MTSVKSVPREEQTVSSDVSAPAAQRVPARVAVPPDVRDALGMTPAGTRRSRSWHWLRWLVLVAIVGGVGLYVALHRAAAPLRYATTPARRGDLTVTVTATGTLAALDTVDVGTEVSGVVDVVAADYNDRVAKGQVLAVVNTDQLRAQIRQDEAALRAAQATAAQTAATLAETQPQAARAESLFARRVLAQQDVEGARASLARAVASDMNARALVDASSAALDAHRTVLGKATIRSPISGVVLQRQIESGRTVAASFQTPVLFVLAADLEHMTLALDIDEADVGQVRAGQTAAFTVDAYPDRMFAAVVRSVRNDAKTVEGVVTYQAILDVANPDRALRPGMTATAVVNTSQVHDALLVPNAALRFVPPTASSPTTIDARTASSGNTHRVWMLDHGAPVPVPLTVRLTDGQWTEIVGGNISAGAPLITGLIDTNTPASGAAKTSTPATASPGASRAR